MTKTTTLQPHQQRVVDEHAERLERLRRLRAFIADEKVRSATCRVTSAAA